RVICVRRDAGILPRWPGCGMGCRDGDLGSPSWRPQTARATEGDKAVCRPDRVFRHRETRGSRKSEALFATGAIPRGTPKKLKNGFAPRASLLWTDPEALCIFAHQNFHACLQTI